MNNYNGNATTVATYHEQHDKVVISPLGEVVGASDNTQLVGMLNPPQGKLAAAIYRALDELESEQIAQWWKGTPESASSPTTAAAFAYKRLMRTGLSNLLDNTSLLDRQDCSDAVEYSRAVALDPQDSDQRASARWVRSCSDLYHTLIKRFGPKTLSTARDGNTKLVADHYQGSRLSVSHVDKKANFKKYSPMAVLGAAYYPASSPLAVGCYESGEFPCSMLLSAWLSPEEAVKFATISHIGVSDDYGSWTLADEDLRLRLVAQGLGAALEFGGMAPGVLVENSVLQGVGISTDEATLESALAWRAVSGATTMYNGYIVAGKSLESGLVAAEVMIAIHDLFDWRSDIAGGNSENVFSVAYGLSIANHFHAMLETALRRAMVDPRGAAYAIGAIGIMTFTACRYASFNYLNLGVDHEGPCPECIRLTKAISEEAGLVWAPKPPPKSFEEGHQIRQLGKLWVDRFEDHGLVQEGLSFFQNLIATGEIFLFDAAVKLPQLDTEAGWS